MKIFITGGTGFIGSHFIRKALALGHDLTCLRRPGSKTRVVLKSEPTWIEGSLEDDLRNDMEGCDALLHLAAHSTNAPYDSIEKCLYWNLTVSLQLMQRARESGIRKYIITGTGFEYGQSGERYDYIPVDAHLKPSMSYPASKAAASIAFYQWAIEHKLKMQYLRIFQVFGEGEEENRLWPSLKKAAIAGENVDLTEGLQVRDFTPVENVANQLIQSLEFDRVEYGKPVFRNIGSGNPCTVRDFAKYWWKKWGAKGKLNFGSVPYRKNEVMRYIPDISDNICKENKIQTKITEAKKVKS